MKPYFLCMESGGTKTLTCGIDLDGNIIYQYHNGVGSPAVDYELALKNIFERSFNSPELFWGKEIAIFVHIIIVR